jgi:uncharacterized protein YjbI with pentapeptide repeats
MPQTTYSTSKSTQAPRITHSKSRPTRQHWTGFQRKTLWDWLELLIIPIVLTIGGFTFDQLQTNREENRAEQRTASEQAIATDNQREGALQSYFDNISELLLDKNLRTSQANPEIRSVARTRTLSTLRRLDGERKGILTQALHEAELISKSLPLISLQRADLSDANLSLANLSLANLAGADLSDANLAGANLAGADLSDANLAGADLTYTNLSDANFTYTNLSDANLAGANLTHAKLAGANLADANLADAILADAILSDANLARANLSGADLSDANLAGAYLSRAILSGAILAGAILSEDARDSADLTLEQLKQVQIAIPTPEPQP